MTTQQSHTGDSTEIVTNVYNIINGIVVTTEAEPFEYSRYGFVRVKDHYDEVNGYVPGNAVVYTGKENLAVHYTAGEPTDDVPQAVIDTVESKRYEIIQGSDVGWINWNGRPEVSKTYFDAYPC